MDVTQNDTSQQHDSTQHYEVLQELGDCYTSVGNYSQAKKYYERAAILATDEAGPYVGLGIIALQENQLEDAQAAFKVACRLDNNCAKAFAGLGLVAQKQADYKQSFDMYLKCLELDNDNIAALLGLFQTSCQMGSFEKVTHYLEVYLDMHPGDTSVMYPLAALYLKDGRLEQSRQMLLDLLTLDSKHKDASNLLEEVEHGLAHEKQAKMEIR